MKKQLTYLMFLLGSVFALSACIAGGGGGGGQVVYSGEPEETEPSGAGQEDSQPPQAPSIDAVRRAMIIADILFEARKALDDNRLMEPRRDNAYDRFREVLSYDPDNQIALEGLDMIVERYVQLADAAITIGNFDEAESLLGRGGSLGRLSGLIDSARERLAQARRQDLKRYSLDPRQLSAQSLEIMIQLGEIARELQRDEDARFLITARSDPEGRWIYQVMRQAVGGYRLRGNIAIGSEPGVQIQYPPS